MKKTALFRKPKLFMPIGHIGSIGRISHIACTPLLVLALSSCSPEPPLHLYDAQSIATDLPIIDLDLQVYWNYDMEFGINYDWKAEWYYSWDEEDRELWGELGYTEPHAFNLRRYYTAMTPFAPHTAVISNTVEGKHFQGQYDWGFWDILVWNNITTLDGVQSLIFDEETTLDSVTARTNESMRIARYQAPRYQHAFYEPEPLFSGYDQGIDINRNLEGFTYDPEREVYVKQLNMMLRPITYIYLTQVILHHNRGRIAAVEGMANLSGMARYTTLNTGRSGDDAVTVNYSVRLKRNCPLVPYGTRADDVPDTIEIADIVGGRLMTFGICNLTANNVTRADEVKDPHRHYMDLNMQFNNGLDSTFVFDVTDQVRRRYKGGVITVELDVDTVRIPKRSGGSGFDAVVEETQDGGTHEFEM